MILEPPSDRDGFGCVLSLIRQNGWLQFSGGLDCLDKLNHILSLQTFTTRWETFAKSRTLQTIIQDFCSAFLKKWWHSIGSQKCWICAWQQHCSSSLHNQLMNYTNIYFYKWILWATKRRWFGPCHAIHIYLLLYSRIACQQSSKSIMYFSWKDKVLKTENSAHHNVFWKEDKTLKHSTLAWKRRRSELF